MRTANWIDLVLQTFDQQYQWGSRPADEPKVPAGKAPSLRALWAHWIDKIELAGIEAVAGEWSDSAADGFRTKWRPQGALLQWYNAAFDRGGAQPKGPNQAAADGFASKAEMKFPRPFKGKTGQAAVDASEFGAWGVLEMTLDAQGNMKKLPPPAKLD
jgi:hypothetical protein